MAKYRIRNWSFVLIALVLISWGKIGHRAIGYIAAAHLTPKTAQAIKDLLGNETLADVSTYADELRTDSFFHFTAPWHYIDVPAGENFSQFTASVFGTTTPNLYAALRHWQTTVADNATSRSVRIFALKMIVHLVGDLHQPLHVARAGDKGGNLIPVWFDNEQTNLHALWDTKLIEHQGLSDQDLAKTWDYANAEDIKNWQSDPVISWFYESNHISGHIYEETPPGKKVDQLYFDQHIGLIRQRIDQAGIRLAGLLNQIFDLGNRELLADTVICEKVFDGKFLESKQITFLNLGAAYPNQTVSVVIKGSDRNKFKIAPEKLYVGKTICVTGSLIVYKGKPEMLVSDPAQIVLK